MEQTDGSEHEYGPARCSYSCALIRESPGRRNLSVHRSSDFDNYGRRVRKTDPEYGIKRLLLRNIEDLTDEQFDKL